MAKNAAIKEPTTLTPPAIPTNGSDHSVVPITPSLPQATPIADGQRPLAPIEGEPQRASAWAVA